MNSAMRIISRYHIYNVAVSILIAATMAACGCSSSHDFKLVSQRGANDAQTFVQRASSMSQMQMEGFLLKVRANEHEYRSEGRSALADAYIEAFEVTLAHRSDSLANIILGPEATAVLRGRSEISISDVPAPVASKSSSSGERIVQNPDLVDKENAGDVLEDDGIIVDESGSVADIK